MFEKLTAFLPKLHDTKYGEWIFDKENDGTADHPLMAPYVEYNQIVIDFEYAIYEFIEAHKEMGLYDYREIISKSGIEWNSGSLRDEELASLDGRTVMALILGAIRADRFCEGAHIANLNDGSIIKWLERLKAIDES